MLQVLLPLPLNARPMISPALTGPATVNDYRLMVAFACDRPAATRPMTCRPSKVERHGMQWRPFGRRWVQNSRAAISQQGPIPVSSPEVAAGGFFLRSMIQREIPRESRRGDDGLEAVVDAFTTGNPWC